LDQFTCLLLSQPKNVVGASTEVGVVHVFVGAVPSGGEFVLEEGHLLLELSSVSTGLDNTFLKSPDIIINGRSVVAA
jgi:hypothetical protein